MKYFWVTLKHKWYILQAARKVGLSLWLALIHDLSKFSWAELPHYDRQFFGDKGDPEGFAVAWLHHQNCNPHHPEYWVTRSDHSHGGSGAVDGCLCMPMCYTREMVADWLGASKAYTGSWDMCSWLNKNLDSVHIHPRTRLDVETLLREMSYTQTEGKWYRKWDGKIWY